MITESKANEGVVRRAALSAMLAYRLAQTGERREELLELCSELDAAAGMPPGSFLSMIYEWTGGQKEAVSSVPFWQR